MKHINFLKKIIVLSSAVLVIIILCSMFYFGVASSKNNIKNESDVTDTDLTPFEKQKLEKEIELEEKLCNFDKENIAEISVYLVVPDDEKQRVEKPHKIRILKKKKPQIRIKCVCVRI